MHSSHALICIVTVLWRYVFQLRCGVQLTLSYCICSVEFMVEKLQSYTDSNILNFKSEHSRYPDCGLKTRDWKEVIPPLKDMVQAAATMRAQVGASA